MTEALASRAAVLQATLKHVKPSDLENNLTYTLNLLQESDPSAFRDVLAILAGMNPTELAAAIRCFGKHVL